MKAHFLSSKLGCLGVALPNVWVQCQHLVGFRKRRLAGSTRPPPPKNKKSSTSHTHSILPQRKRGPIHQSEPHAPIQSYPAGPISVTAAQMALTEGVARLCCLCEPPHRLPPRGPLGDYVWEFIWTLTRKKKQEQQQKRKK